VLEGEAGPEDEPIEAELQAVEAEALDEALTRPLTRP